MPLSVLGVIPARGGSRGVPRKNIRLLAGRPLVAWTIDAARKSKTSADHRLDGGPSPAWRAVRRRRTFLQPAALTERREDPTRPATPGHESPKTPTATS